MTLEELVNNIDKIDNPDEDLVIYQKNELSIDSEVYLFNRGNDDLVITKENIDYMYFLEVDIAIYFIKDYMNSLKTKPSSKEIALRLLHYAMYNA